MIKKIFKRILLNFIPMIVFSIITEFALYYAGYFFFGITFDLHVIFFVFVAVKYLFPLSMLILIFYSIIVKGQYTKKNLLIEYIIYFSLHFSLYVSGII